MQDKSRLRLTYASPTTAWHTLDISSFPPYLANIQKKNLNKSAFIRHFPLGNNSHIILSKRNILKEHALIKG